MKLTKDQREQVEALALKLYDLHNPNPNRQINVGKDKCIVEAEKRLGFRKQERQVMTNIDKETTLHDVLTNFLVSHGRYDLEEDGTLFCNDSNSSIDVNDIIAELAAHGFMIVRQGNPPSADREQVG